MLEIEPVISVAFYVLGKTVNWGISTIKDRPTRSYSKVVVACLKRATSR